MSSIEKIVAVALLMAFLLALDLLKVNDPELKYVALTLVGLITGGHLVVNSPIGLK
jgi:hypothetical protein